MSANIFLIKGEGGSISLNLETPIGLLPAIIFSDIKELKRFAMGLLGYVEYHAPTVPKVFTDAFKEEDTKC